MIKVSIITIVLNNKLSIARTIDSVSSQTYEDIEYIIIDGGSTDGTLDLIKNNVNKISHFVSEPDKGLYDAMNKGIYFASGEIICFLNSGDFYINSSVISDVVSTFNKNRSVMLVLANVEYVYVHDLKQPVRFYSSFRFLPWKMRYGFMPAHPATFILSSAYKLVGEYKLGYEIAADFDMLVRMFIVHKLPYTYHNKTIVRMDVGGVSSSGIKSFIIASKEMFRSLKENKIYSNHLFLLARLPIKIAQIIFFRLECKLRGCKKSGKI